jgi:hypothetical protein
VRPTTPKYQHRKLPILYRMIWKDSSNSSLTGTMKLTSLRQKFKISKTEERFRLDHSPENKQKTHEYKKLKTSLLKKIE